MRALRRDELVDRVGRDATRSTNVHDLELSGTDQLVHGRAADRKSGRGFGNGEENRVDGALWSVAGCGWTFVSVRVVMQWLCALRPENETRFSLDFAK